MTIVKFYPGSAALPPSSPQGTAAPTAGPATTACTTAAKAAHSGQPTQHITLKSQKYQKLLPIAAIISLFV